MSSKIELANSMTIQQNAAMTNIMCHNCNALDMATSAIVSVSNP